MPSSHTMRSKKSALTLFFLMFFIISLACFGLFYTKSTSFAEAFTNDGLFPDTTTLPPASLPNGVAAGDVTTQSVVLWARSRVTGEITFTYGIPGQGQAGVITTVVSDVMLPVTVALASLQPSSIYRYRVTTSVSDSLTGTFATAALTGTYTGLRFGVSGDWRGELGSYPSIRNVSERNLAFFVEHGDTIYADFPSPALPISQATTLADYRIKQSEVYSTNNGLNTLADLRAKMAVFATLDDHEVINDFAGGAPVSSDPRFSQTTGLINDTSLFENGVQAFQEFNPILAEFYATVGGDGRMDNERKFYRYRTFGSDAALIVLDSRSFRDTPIKPLQSTNLLAVLQFLTNAFQTGRTLLGAQQLQDLQRDLLDAQQQGITWKFVAVPEPIQNLGPFAAEDRFEGYSAERTSLLKFINDNKISNVVFVSADIHGTVVNNLTYQTAPLLPQIPTTAFEISTGSVAFDAPFGPTVVNLATQLGVITPTTKALYETLPVQNDADSLPNDKDDFVKVQANNILQPIGYDPIGLEGSSINATLLQGDYIAVHSFGWTEFEIDKETQVLIVTTYGIAPYTAQQLAADPSGIMSRTPTVVSQFTVKPVGFASQRVYLPAVSR